MTNSPQSCSADSRDEPKLYTLKLTKRELWILSQNYAAAFTDPAARDEIELRVSEKLDDLYLKASKS